MMHLPNNYNPNIARLSSIFNHTVATYKFYWFISLLDIHVKTGKSLIRIWDVVISMVANAWYPIHYFRLSFGKVDSMYTAIKAIQELTGLTYDASPKEIIQTLRSQLENPEMKRILKVFTLNVPFRFLSPWINTSDTRLLVKRSQNFENDALYALYPDEIDLWVIKLNPNWIDYLNRNYMILRDFTYWNLTNFLSVRNPNVPNIAQKLVKPNLRRSLHSQHQFWDQVIIAEGGIHCIYTGKELHAGEYDLDHFIPWNFVSHDLAWNLLPADSSVNSSKSDKIPDLGTYLPRMAKEHQSALRTFATHDFRSSIVDDYMTLGYTIEDLLSMDEEHFYDVYYHTFAPMGQLARNMGFEAWKYE